MLFTYPAGATPLDFDEAQGLIPKHIVTQAELNEWEQANILEAEGWAFLNKHKQILTFDFIQKLHKKMFDKTWRWAGKFRHSNKNIGIDWENIPTQLKLLLDDVAYQIEHSTYAFDEIAGRFHHRLVSIHPFPNGNGRHARFMTDILLVNAAKQRFTWGSQNLNERNSCRQTYLKALRNADNHDYTLLLQFVRS